MRINSVLITGSNRGIGLEFVKQFLKLASPPNVILATCRNPETAEELQLIAKANPSVKVLKLDLEDQEYFPKFRQILEQEISLDELNLLINNGGIAIRETLEEVTKESMLKNFEINCVSPLLLTKELLPLLKKAASKEPGDEMSCGRAAVVNISSKIGSIEDNGSGMRYPYRASKVALNMATKSLSIDLESMGILVFAFHPGWVRTDMGGQSALLTTERSVQSMVDFIQGASEQQIGSFRNYDGRILPW